MCAHEFESGFVVGEEAWHGLATVVHEAPTVQEALKLAGLDWTVDLQPIFLRDGTEVPDRSAVIRSSDNRVLGTVGPWYKPLQNSEAFDFFNPFLHERDCTLETAGSLRNGSRVWVLAKIQGAEGEVVKGDNVIGYLLLSNSHDGSLAVTVQFTAIRVVCMNTLTAALGEAEDGEVANVKIRHTKGLHVAMREVQKAINLSKRTFEFSLEAYRRMVRERLPVSGFKQYVRDIFEVPQEEEKMPRSYEMLEALFHGGKGQDISGVGGTVYAGYNAVTEWIDHERGKTPEGGLEASWYGPGATMRQKAFDVAMGLCK